MKHFILTLVLLSMPIISLASNESEREDRCRAVSAKAASFMHAKRKGEYLSSVERSIDATTGDPAKAAFLKNIAREAYEYQLHSGKPGELYDDSRIRKDFYSRCMQEELKMLGK